MSSAVVEITKLRQLARNPQLRDRLPCLASVTESKIVRTSARRCGKCNKSKHVTEVNPEDEMNLKKCLYQSSGNVRDLAKTILGVEHLIFYFDVPGLPQRVTV